MSYTECDLGELNAIEPTLGNAAFVGNAIAEHTAEDYEFVLEGSKTTQTFDVSTTKVAL